MQNLANIFSLNASNQTLKQYYNFFSKYEPRNVYKLKKSGYCETNTNPKYWLTELIKIVLTIKTTLILSL